MHGFSQCKRLLLTYTALRRLYVFCDLSSLCVRIRILRVKRLVHTYTDFARYAAYTYVCGFWVLIILCVHIRILDYFNVSVIRYWGFVDLFDVPMIRFWGSLIRLTFVRLIVMNLLEDLPGEYDLQGSFTDDLYILIGPYWGSFFWVLSRSLFRVVHAIQRPTLTSDRLLLRNTITRCSNITVHYDCYV